MSPHAYCKSPLFGKLDIGGAAWDDRVLPTFVDAASPILPAPMNIRFPHPTVCSLGFGFVAFALLLSPVRAEEAAAKMNGPAKVRVIVKENNPPVAAGATSAATPAAAGGAKPAAGGAQQNQAQAAANAADAEKFTRTTKKSLSVALVNLTAAPMDVTAKTTFLAKDEAGKHEVVTEKTVENKVTLQPGKAGEFTTEEVSFTHTAAHRSSQKPGGGGSGGGGKPVASPMLPASGHAYFGYKVDVFQGNDLVGTAVSSGH